MADENGKLYMKSRDCKPRIKIIECLCLGTIGLIVAPWKFDVLKTSIFALEASLLGKYASFKNIKFPRGNYQPIVPRQKHSIV